MSVHASRSLASRVFSFLHLCYLLSRKTRSTSRALAANIPTDPPCRRNGGLPCVAGAWSPPWATPPPARTTRSEWPCSVLYSALFFVLSWILTPLMQNDDGNTSGSWPHGPTNERTPFRPVKAIKCLFVFCPTGANALLSWCIMETGSTTTAGAGCKFCSHLLRMHRSMPCCSCDTRSSIYV